MDIQINDIVNMKKSHPCGSHALYALRTGLNLKLRCIGCGRELMLPRQKVEKQIKTIRHKEDL